MERIITQLLEHFGEDPGREGLQETPARVLRSFNFLLSGYKQNPVEILTVFSEESYDQMVLLSNIEMYSLCEHHLLPFFGKAHVAYIPDGRLVGISKLARLVDIFSRRLQIQERIGNQVVDILMEHLEPRGAACVIEAEHLCMRMRGVQKQNSIMTTSALRGVFLETAARAELFQLIKG